LPFQLLADTEHEVANAYGVYIEKRNYGKTYWGTQRATFVIGPTGKILRVFPNVKVEGHADEVLAALRESPAQA
jgi:peroxiredoxin Q/BCP